MTERWRPETLEDLQSFIDNGLAEENHFREFKERLPSNKSVAKTLAGFAIDGGDLVIGVAERHADTFTIAPLGHAGQPEKVEQIGQTLVDRPLLVETRVLKDADDPALGALWITVPQSPGAPHQVGGTYYERGDKQTRPMSDAAVERLIRSRRTTLEGIESVLLDAMAKDTAGELPHIIGVARPIGAARDELYEAIGGAPGWAAFGHKVRNELQLSMPFGGPGPGRYTLSNQHHNQRARAGEGWYSEFSFFDDGAIKWFSEDGSIVAPDGGGAGQRRLALASFVRAGWEVVAAMRAVAKETGHRRSWHVAIGVTRTRGLRGYLFHSAFYDPVDVPPFPDERYIRVQRVSGLQVENDVWAVVRSLTHRFVEGFGSSFELAAKQFGYEANP